MKLDILAFGVHPDDIELGCSGTIAKQVIEGKRVGVIDLTEGELGSRGTVELRYKESAVSSKILGISVRDNLKMADGFFTINKESQELVISAIRKYQPEIILCNAPSDRHPDHGRASELVVNANFYSGLSKIKTLNDGKDQAPWRANIVLHYIQDRYLNPDVIIDITETFDLKMKAIGAFKSQFYNPESDEPETPISSPEFIEVQKGRSLQFGRYIHEIGRATSRERVSVLV